MEESVIETRRLDNLKPWEKNPREVSEEGLERLKTQIRELGVYKPLLITHDGTVLGGNQRLKAFKELGITHVKCSVVQAPDDETKTKYALSDNDRAGHYTTDLLGELLEDMPELDLAGYAIDIEDPTLLEDVDFSIDFELPEQEKDNDTSTPQKKTTKCPECGHVFTP